MTILSIIAGIWAAAGIGLAAGVSLRLRDPHEFSKFQDNIEATPFKWRPDRVGAAVLMFLFAPIVVALFMKRKLGL